MRSLQKAGIPVKYFESAPEYFDMHAKVAIFDGKEVLGGSTNWMRGAMRDFNEVGVWVQGPVNKELSTTFEQVWEHRAKPVPPIGFADRAKAGLAKALAHWL